MGGFFYQLGRLAGPKVRKAKWIFRSLTGTEAEVIQAEFEAGRDLARALLQELGGDPDPGVARLLDELGGRLADRVVNRQRKFSFRPLQSAEPNALALPGGFIFVTRSLVELCGSNRDELAFILGHEMGHVIRKHALDRMVTSTVLNAALRAVPVGGLMRSQVGGVVMQLLQQGYSQDRELEADELGVRLARSAGFDAAAAIRLLERLKQTSIEPPGLGVYFSSHPPFDLRISQIARYLKGR